MKNDEMDLNGASWSYSFWNLTRWTFTGLIEAEFYGAYRGQLLWSIMFALWRTNDLLLLNKIDSSSIELNARTYESEQLELDEAR